jgi:hypothetical protein
VHCGVPVGAGRWQEAQVHGWRCRGCRQRLSSIAWRGSVLSFPVLLQCCMLPVGSAFRLRCLYVHVSELCVVIVAAIGCWFGLLSRV